MNVVKYVLVRLLGLEVSWFIIIFLSMAVDHSRAKRFNSRKLEKNYPLVRLNATEF